MGTSRLLNYRIKIKSTENWLHMADRFRPYDYLGFFILYTRFYL